jgi:hypothetical protein
MMTKIDEQGGDGVTHRWPSVVLHRVGGGVGSDAQIGQ